MQKFWCKIKLVEIKIYVKKLVEKLARKIIKIPTVCVFRKMVVEIIRLFFRILWENKEIEKLLRDICPNPFP